MYFVYDLHNKLINKSALNTALRKGQNCVGWGIVRLCSLGARTGPAEKQHMEWFKTNLLIVAVFRF